jgi:polyvinyl alcohol dehydrogenase (cytochrome)
MRALPLMISTVLLLLLLTALIVEAQGVTGAAPNGEALYEKTCASCHDQGVGRAPNRVALKQMSPENIHFALVNGSMSPQGFGLSTAQIAAISEFLTGKTVSTDTFSKQAFCPAGGSPFEDPFAKPYWNGWGANLSQQRFQPAAMAQLSAGQVPKLKLRWAFAFPGDTRAYAQPTVVGGRIFVGSAGRRVYSLDAKTGCIYWIFDADFPVRTAISVSALGDGWVAYFGDQHANAYAVNALTGSPIWKTQVEEHPAGIITGAPTLAENRLYVPVTSFEEVTGADPNYECCKFRGSVSALDAATGKVIWKGYTIDESPHPVRRNKQGVQLWGPSGAGVWSSPTIDLKKRAVYVTTSDSYSDPPARTSDAFLAFDMETGKLLWSRQMTPNDAYTIDCASPTKTNCAEANGPDFDFGSSPILVDLPGGGRALIAGQKSGMIHAVDPDRQGELLWQVRLGRGSVLGGIQWGSAVDAKNVYAAVSDVELAPATENKAGARRMVLGGTVLLNPETGGGIFALDAATGRQVWHTPNPGCHDRPGCSPAQSAAVTAIVGAVFSGSLDGHLRAYATGNGAIIWDVNTAREYETVNGVKGNGGSIDGPGPVVVNGMLFTNSGYGAWGGAPGNVLLAFSVNGK